MLQKMGFVNAAGEKISFDNFAPRVFWKADGLGLAGAEAVYTQAVGQHGYSLASVLLSSRIVRMTGHVHGVDNEEMYRLRYKTASVCNPLLGAGTLMYENDSGKWQTGAFVRDMNYGEKGFGIQTIEIVFECPSPFWLSQEEKTVRLSYVEGGLEFPLKFPAFFGTLGYRAEINNEGNGVVPIRFSIGGGSKNPVIKNKTTGQKIQINRGFHESDRLYINTDPDDISVKFETTDAETNEKRLENAFGFLTDDSELFTLAPGINEVLFYSDDNNRKVSVVLSYRDRYAGV